MITVWILVSLSGSPSPTYSPFFANEESCKEVKAYVDRKKFESATRCMKLQVAK